MAPARLRHIGRCTVAWVRAMRLQFYPMTWLAYWLGAVAATGGEPLATSIYWVGFAILVLMEMATVFTNELVDFDTDRRNRNAGPFNGGSRVLVDGCLAPSSLKSGASVAIAGALLALAAAIAAAPAGSALAAGTVVVTFSALALGYTLPPLQLVYRGAGELTVAATHSTGPLLLGYALQGGSILEPAPWLLSIPVLLAILPSITIAGIPDYEADRAVGKGTLAVRRGSCRAVSAALAATLAAALAAAVVSWLMGPVYGGWGGIILLHCVVLAGILYRYRRSGAPVRRIDGILVVALMYIA